MQRKVVNFYWVDEACHKTTYQLDHGDKFAQEKVQEDKEYFMKNKRVNFELINLIQ